MTTIARRPFKLNPIAAALLLAVAANLPTEQALANGAYGANTDIAGNTISVPTYFANSSQGIQKAWDPRINAISKTLTVDTGKPIRKFVDQLSPAGSYNGLAGPLGSAGLAAGVPLALAEKWVDLNGNTTTDDYYEVAIVEYTEQMHSDLPKETRLRGYVQVETATMLAASKTDIIGGKSEHILATYPNGQPILDKNGAQVYFVHKPHYLGPVILAKRGTAVRMKMTNYLPYTDVNGNSVGSINGMGGELFIPVDETIAGGGPILDKDGIPVKDGAGNLVKMAQNRAGIHWHGGDTPWISDGTPHQWFAPAGDISYIQQNALYPSGMGKGVSAASVPDMPNPGDGSYNLYYPNQMSGRLMFYHDHTSGLTRLNVYVGEAAGYVIYDDVELAMSAKTLGTTLAATSGGLPTGLLDSVGIPWVLEEKTFVPKNIGPNAVASDGVTPQSQDAKWNTTHWGQPGDLWFPHVYETNQDPNSADGTNPVGRWDWGPWFWPVFPAQFSLPTGEYGDVTLTPESFLDTATVNGKVYPTMTVDPKTYRFRILNASNDRTVNLSLFQAVDGAGNVCDSRLSTPPVPNATVVYTGTAADTPATCTELKMVPAMPGSGFPAKWPVDGRPGGVPDPATAGPDLVQIGSEGGLLPAPAIYPAQPLNYETNVRSITLLNILDHGVLLTSAERADVMVDFSKYAGKTLILFNDAPTPMPATDPRTDHFTNGGDKTDAGGAHNTEPGYGPNTRTFLQIKVNATNTSGVGGPMNVAQLAADLPVAYAASQPKPVIPEAAYNGVFGTNDKDSYASIGTGSGTHPYFTVSGKPFALTGVTLDQGGSGYPVGTTATFSAPDVAPGVAATATVVLDPVTGAITGLTNFNAGSGYNGSKVPVVTFSAPNAGGKRAAATVQVNSIKIVNKAIQELFDPIYGRMNATFGAELPLSSAIVATTIPLNYVDVPIERLDAIKDGETQIWKITHNGVDGHPVHFHLVNVQVINRVRWDGTIRPPEANELGWKETVRMNPLEDIYVAVRANRPVVPFGVPKSARLLDPAAAKDSTVGLTNIDPNTGQAPTFQPTLVNGVMTNVPTTFYSNQLADFDNEYVWHCHILGHEENDFMRPFIFHPTVLVPDAPAAVTLDAVNTKLTWVDTTPLGGQDAQGIPTAGTNQAYPEPTNSPKNEIGSKIYRMVTTAVTTKQPDVNNADGTVTVGASTLANTYQLVPLGAVPANATTWIDASLAALAPADTATPADAAGVTTTTNVSYSYSVMAYNAAGNSALGTSATTTNAGALVGVAAPLVNSAVGAPAPTGQVGPTGLTQTVNLDKSVSLSFTGVPGATGYEITVNGAVVAATFATNGNTVTATVAASALPAGAVKFGVQAMVLSGNTQLTTTTVSNGAALVPVAVTASQFNPAGGPGSIALTWANNPGNVNNVSGLTLTWVLQGSAATPASKTFPANSTGVTITNLSKDKKYNFTLTAVSNLGNSPSVTKQGLSQQ
jgi:FtsP/CotA-like multicopper oxidase with cupredoxin domain